MENATPIYIRRQLSDDGDRKGFKVPATGFSWHACVSEVLQSDSFNQALRDRNIPLAQSLLDEARDSLSDFNRCCLQARVHISAEQPENAIKVLAALPDPSENSRRFFHLQAQAYLALSDPKSALQALENAPYSESAPPTLVETKLQISVLSAVGDRAKTVAGVKDALIAFPDETSLTAPAIRALITVGALRVAADIISERDANKVAKSTLSEFVRACLDRKDTALLHQYMPRFKKSQNQYIYNALRKVLETSEVEIQRAEAAQWIVKAVATAGLETSNFRVATQLFQYGFELEARAVLSNIKQPTENRSQENQASSNSASRNLAPIMGWLNIPSAQQVEWQALAIRGQEESELRKGLLASDSSFFQEFVAQLAPSDLSPLRELSKLSKPAIMATTHAGILMGTLQHLRLHQIPVNILGGNPMIGRFVPGGELLNPIKNNQTIGSSLKKTLEYLRDGQLVGIAADGMKGNSKNTFVHRGYAFDFSESIPKIAFNYQVPIVWIATYWRDNRMVCDCVHGPAPVEGESFEKFRNRWFDFLVEKLFDICQCDPRNATFNQKIIRDPISEPQRKPHRQSMQKPK